MLLLVTMETSPHMVLTKRSDRLKTHSGQVAFPGGMQEASDADLLATALRETEEEISLPSNQVKVIGQLNQVVSRHQIKVTPYVGLVAADVELIPCPRELHSVFKVPLEFFQNNEPDRIDQLGFRNHKLAVPCWFYEGYEIWGMSAIVIADFLHTVFDLKTAHLISS